MNNLCFSFDLGSIKKYLGKDFSNVERDFPNIQFDDGGVYWHPFVDDDKQYFFTCMVKRNTVYNVSCTLYVKNPNEQRELFNKLKNGNLMSSGGRILTNNANEYAWIVNNFMITRIRTVVYENTGPGVMLHYSINTQ
jgi:hypothetical protein